MLHVYGKFNILCIAYRGYGSSEGVPNEADMKKDALSVTEFIKTCNKIDNNRVFLFGRSLGGAVALSLASDLDKIGDRIYKGVVIENTFTSIGHMAETLFPFFKSAPWLKRIMLKVNWNSEECVKTLKTPVLFISGD
jgi:pimeloyl-ACP methyl ester carboxylesterase